MLISLVDRIGAIGRNFPKLSRHFIDIGSIVSKRTERVCFNVDCGRDEASCVVSCRLRNFCLCRCGQVKCILRLSTWGDLGATKTHPGLSFFFLCRTDTSQVKYVPGKPVRNEQDMFQIDYELKNFFTGFIIGESKLETYRKFLDNFIPCNVSWHIYAKKLFESVN